MSIKQGASIEWMKRRIGFSLDQPELKENEKGRNSDSLWQVLLVNESGSLGWKYWILGKVDFFSRQKRKVSLQIRKSRPIIRVEWKIRVTFASSSESSSQTCVLSLFFARARCEKRILFHLFPFSEERSDLFETDIIGIVIFFSSFSRNSFCLSSREGIFLLFCTCIKSNMDKASWKGPPGLCFYNLGEQCRTLGIRWVTRKLQ